MATTSLLTQRPADCCWPQQRPGSNISDFFRSWHPNDSMANPFNQVECSSQDQRKEPSAGK
ncbi:unnamed protein product [Notodromas monacha]|uniref:Uncharacterized protein n=1 Tax=Notodromas monacha TaxID=399045 RepID=A0A7R9BXB7_9CRUS|nr:unnamed protein product [Notodromas monacha]CAG0923519.1 unnamed protein product [Notodromas monacha]